MVQVDTRAWIGGRCGVARGLDGWARWRHTSSISSHLSYFLLDAIASLKSVPGLCVRSAFSLCSLASRTFLQSLFSSIIHLPISQRIPQTLVSLTLHNGRRRTAQLILHPSLRRRQCRRLSLSRRRRKRAGLPKNLPIHKAHAPETQQKATLTTTHPAIHPLQRTTPKRTATNHQQQRRRRRRRRKRRQCRTRRRPSIPATISRSFETPSIPWPGPFSPARQRYRVHRSLGYLAAGARAQEPEPAQGETDAGSAPAD